MLPHWTQGDLIVNGKSIHYYRTGDGSKPPVVLAHGFSDGGLCWLPVARDLEAEYDVILPDARGHGLSQPVESGEELDMAGDVAGLIRGLGLDRPVVGGHSMGGSVTGEVGARFPELVRGLILEDPAWFMPRPEPEVETKEEPQENPYHAFLYKAKGMTLEEIIARCRVESPKWAEVELQPWATTKQQFDTRFFETRGSGMNWMEAAALIKSPALLITSGPEEWSIVTPEGAQKAVEINPLIRVVHVSGAGHNIRRDNYPDFMSAVRAFLSEIY